jgi:uncharacterized integral membrane protein
MQNLWLKIKIWTKVTVAGLVALYVLIFVLKNGDEKATFWFWPYHTYDGSLLLLVALTFLIGGLVAILATTTFRTIRQIRELRARNRSQALERELADMKTKAAMLKTKPVPGQGGQGGQAVTTPTAVAPAPASLADVAPPAVEEDEADSAPKP